MAKERASQWARMKETELVRMRDGVKEALSVVRWVVVLESQLEVMKAWAMVKASASMLQG